MITADLGRKAFEDVAALQMEVAVLTRLQAETTAELDALLPAILAHAVKGNL